MPTESEVLATYKEYDATMNAWREARRNELRLFKKASRAADALRLYEFENYEAAPNSEVRLAKDASAKEWIAAVRATEPLEEEMNQAELMARTMAHTYFMQRLTE